MYSLPCGYPVTSCPGKDSSAAPSKEPFQPAYPRQSEGNTKTRTNLKEQLIQAFKGKIHGKQTSISLLTSLKDRMSMWNGVYYEVEVGDRGKMAMERLHESVMHQEVRMVGTEKEMKRKNSDDVQGLHSLEVGIAELGVTRRATDLG